MGKYLDIVRRAEEQPGSPSYEKNDINDQNIRGCQAESTTTKGGLWSYMSFRSYVPRARATLPPLCSACRLAAGVEDGRKFLASWGDQAETLGWTARDLFGLHAVPERPIANYRRLSRYDETGLIWLLRRRPVVALTELTAAIQSSTAAVTYRRFNKPAFGATGESLVISGHREPSETRDPSEALTRDPETFEMDVT